MKAINYDVNPVMEIIKHGVGMHKFKMLLCSCHLCIYSAHIRLGTVALLYV
jgi:hypothetical protein